jgi:hypothetical protein
MRIDEMSNALPKWMTFRPEFAPGLRSRDAAGVRREEIIQKKKERFDAIKGEALAAGEPLKKFRPREVPKQTHEIQGMMTALRRGMRTVDGQ